MKSSKKWYESKTIISGLVAMAMFVIQILGLDLDQALVTEFVVAVFGVIALAFAIYGRLVADKQIK